MRPSETTHRPRNHGTRDSAPADSPASAPSNSGRGGVMPNWRARLDPATLRSVVLSVHSLGGGE